ncbi:MAG: protein kinase [Chthoniobacterales bacterium]|nr:protein kinase [Chthoniobacterales bacterium]
MKSKEPDEGGIARHVSLSLPGASADNSENCARCGAPLLGEGICISCLLHEGLGNEGEPSAEAFGNILAEAHVAEQQWRLGNYEILEEIGRGGMGVIYRARQRHSRRIVALKRVLAYQADSHETLVRFRREAEAAARLDHPHILPIHEVGESEDGLPFFSMKFAAGGSLRAAAAAFRDRPNECVKLIAKVARAIAYAHGEGILHRDLQPGNILLDARGEPMVSDFGLAKWLTSESDLTRTFTSFGTPGFIAPEQAESAAADLTPAADVYSLGAILFGLLAKRPPFVGANVLSVVRQAAAEPAPKLRTLAPALDRDLETICARCLEREPKARYQSAAGLAEDLERWLEGRPILARPLSAPARLWRWSRRNPILSSATLACLVLTSLVVWLLHGRVTNEPELPFSEKSIAVLPFENLSDSKDSSDFGAGIQDDLLTSLAQIHDLKVISHTSVMAYQKQDERNVRAIGRALGVANVLEGSVRRAGNRVLVNVQLIDARNDRHLWAERYDRTVADAIGLQGELATQIAVALKATLAPEEKARLSIKPTANSEAYVLYLTALGKEDQIAAEELCVQATTLDPTFALAYARASLLNSEIAGGGDQPLARKAKARAQAEEALRLSPALGEAHMALGLCLYWGDKNYEAALKEFEVAAATSPNNAEIYTYIGGIYRRQGRWRDAVASFDRAVSLDPRNAHVAFRAANNHLNMRNWVAAADGFNRILELAPNDVDNKIQLAYVELYRNGNPAGGRNILENIPASLESDGWVALTRWDMAMLERDYASAEKILSAFTLRNVKGSRYPKTFFQGRTALARGEVGLAQGYFAAAAPAFEAWAREDPDDPERHSGLGLLYAYMRRKEDALQESRRAVELEPESQDAFHGAIEQANLALVYALVGEPDQAIPLIERLLSTPGAVGGTDFPANITLAELRLRWEWDSLVAIRVSKKSSPDPSRRRSISAFVVAGVGDPGQGSIPGFLIECCTKSLLCRLASPTMASAWQPREGQRDERALNRRRARLRSSPAPLFPRQPVARALIGKRRVLLRHFEKLTVESAGGRARGLVGIALDDEIAGHARELARRLLDEAEFSYP